MYKEFVYGTSEVQKQEYATKWRDRAHAPVPNSSLTTPKFKSMEMLLDPGVVQSGIRTREWEENTVNTAVNAVG